MTERGRSIKQSRRTVKPKSRLLKDITDFVEFQDNTISDTTIGTDSVSSCIFILVVGNLQDHPFAYLSHYPESCEIPSHTSTSTLLYFIDQITNNIEDHINNQPPPNSQQLKINDLNNLQLLIGGGPEEERDLIREAFILLNNPNHHIEHLLKGSPSTYLYQNLKCKAIILNPTTLLLSNDSEDRRGKGGASTTDDCGLVVKYDCCTKLVNIYIEWVGYGVDCTVASLSFVFGEIDPSKLSWKKEENEILSTQKKLESNKSAFQVFNNALNYVVKTVFDARNGYPFNLNREVAGHVQQFVENKHDPSVETDQTTKKFYYDFITDIDKEQLNRFIGYDIQVRSCGETLLRQTKNNPLLIGEQGVDKKAAVIGLVRCILQRQAPDALSKRLLTLNIEALLAVANGRSEFEERLKVVLNEIKDANANVILFIDNIHRIANEEDAEDTTNTANLLKSILGEFQCIGTTTLDKYKKYIEQDPVLTGYFQEVLVKEASVIECISTLRVLKGRYESHFGVQILDPALILAAHLSHRYIMNSILPAKAFRIINEACISIQVAMRRQLEALNQLNVETTSLPQVKDETSKQRLKQGKKELGKIREESESLKLGNKAKRGRLSELKKLKKKSKRRHSQSVQVEEEKNLTLPDDMKCTATSDLETETDKMEYSTTEENKQQQIQSLPAIVTPSTIIEIVSQWNHIPFSTLVELEEYRLSQLRENLYKKIIGQDEAVDRIAEVVRKNRTDSSRKKKPLGSFLFLGPTGFGKTEVAKTLALELFNSTEALIHINMNQYKESYLADELIGASSNSGSFQQRGKLEETVLRNPCVVILFDEIEKAHPRIWDALLEVLKNGYLVDRQNQTVFFTYSIIILTSNVGEQYISQAIENPLSTANPFDGKLSQTIKDCVMNEIHLHFRPEFLNCLNIVFFQSLNINQLSPIIHLQLRSLEEYFKDEDIKISLTDAAVQSILKQSYNPACGVRPVKNHVEQNITTELFKLIIQMKIKPHCHLTINIADNNTYGVHAQSSLD